MCFGQEEMFCTINTDATPAPKKCLLSKQELSSKLLGTHLLKGKDKFNGTLNLVLSTHSDP